MNTNDEKPTTEPQTQAPTEEQPQEGEKLSKAQIKKLEKQRLKEEKARKEEEERLAKEKEAMDNDPLRERYGDLPMIQSREQTDRVWTSVKDIDESCVDKELLIRARLHNSRVKGNLGFLVLRQQFSDIQAVIQVKEGSVSKPMIKWVAGIPKESIVEIIGVPTKPDQEIKSTSQKVELRIERIYCVSRSYHLLPFQLDDASRPIQKGEVEMEDYDNASDLEASNAQKQSQPSTEEEKKDDKLAIVSLKTKLDNRVIDLRTKANQGIFRVQAGVCQLFREFLYTNGFTEIHSPKLIGGSSEGGANIFKFKYFGKDGCLAQSPQLYKQMAVMSDLDRVFEIGPVFRAEKSFTHRHMCEFTGLDFEMAIKESYHEILDLSGELFGYIFKGLETRYQKELAAIQEQYPFDPFKFKSPVVKITFEEGCKLLKEIGVEQSPYEDLSTETERKLGAIVREKYETDFYILHKFPQNARPFYTMPCPNDKNFTNSYDFFMRGEEIVSGAQRIHDPEFLAKRAGECGIDVATLKDYIEAFKYGAYPHGGVGVGLERVVMLYLALGNIRKSSMFPRDPKRIAP